MVNKAAGNQHVKSTSEICKKEEKPLYPAKEERVQIVKNDVIPFLDMKMSWSPEGELKFGVFRKKGQQLKYSRKESNHTPGTLRAIPLGVLNRLSKLTLRKPSINSEAVDKIYPGHANALHKAGIAPPNFPITGDLWGNQGDNVDMEKEQDVSKR